MTLSTTATEVAGHAPAPQLDTAASRREGGAQPCRGIHVAKGSVARTSSGLASSPAIFLPPPGI